MGRCAYDIAINPDRLKSRRRNDRTKRIPETKREKIGDQRSFNPSRGGPLALPILGVYHASVLNKPLINVEEKIDRIVGRRTKMPDSLKTGMQLQSLGVELHKTFEHRWCPKGVYRFKTHEEADQWMIKMLARSGIPES